MTNRKNFKKISVLLAFVTLLAIFAPQLTHAIFHDTLRDPLGIGNTLDTAFESFGIGDILGSAIAWVMFVMSYVMTYLASFVIALITFGIRVVLELNNHIVDSIAVQKGFGITLAIANLGFVLGIIVIAIATILRSQTYGIKQILWKLVVAAILVNFSLVIAGPIIGLANGFTGHFLRAVPGGGGTSFTKFASAIAGAFQPQRAFLAGQLIEEDEVEVSEAAASLEAKLSGVGRVGQNFAVLLTPIIGLFFSLAMLIVIIVTLAVLFVMLLIRYVILAILLILMPLAWLMWVFPNLRGNWSRWWSTFLRWTFFAPLVVFFLYLAILTSGAMNKAGEADPLLAISAVGVTPTDATGLIGGVQQFASAFAAPIMGYFLQAAVVVGLAVGGMFAANSLSIIGAGVAMGAMKGARVAVQGYVGKGARGAGGAVMERVRTAGRRYDDERRETTTALQRFGGRLQGIPVLRGVGTAIARQGAPEAETRLGAIEKHQKENLKPLDEQGLLRRAKARGAFVSPVAAAATAQELAKRDLLSKLTPELQKSYVDVAERMGNIQKIYSNRPDFVRPHPGESLEEALQRVVEKIKVSDTPDIAHESLGDHASPSAQPTKKQINVALNLSNPQLGRIGSEGNAKQIDAFRNTIRQTLDQHTAGTLTLSAKQQERMERIIDYLEHSQHWQSI